MPPDQGLTHPFAEPPEPGGLREVAPGVLWLRLALPFVLDHVNAYLLEEPGGWALLDPGLGDERTRAALQPVLEAHRPTRLLVTHFHPDHAGLAGALCEQHGIPLHMPREEHATAARLSRPPASEDGARHQAFYRRHGFDAAAAERIAGDGHAYLRATTGVPEQFQPLAAGEVLALGGRRLEVLTGGGHAPEQAMLLDRDAGLFFSADQVLARISPNVGVWWTEPESDPLGDYLSSLRALAGSRDAAGIPTDVLVLPGHGLPFRGVQARIAALLAHHEERCAALLAACAGRPRTLAEATPGLFRRPLDSHGMGFAMREMLAHANRLLREGRMRRLEGDVLRYVAV